MQAGQSPVYPIRGVFEVAEHSSCPSSLPPPTAPEYHHQINPCLRGDGRVPCGTGEQRGATQSSGSHRPAGPAAGKYAQLGPAGTWADQLQQWPTGERLQVTRILELLAGLSGIVCVPVALGDQTQLAQGAAGSRWE